jgi:outer membrane protein
MSKKSRVRTLTSCLPAYVVIGLLCIHAGCFAPMDTTSMEDYIGPAGIRQRSAATQPATAPAETPPESTQPVSTQPEAVTPTVPPSSLTVTVEDAVFLSLENNRSLAVERLKPQVRRTGEQQALAAFDPVLTGGTQYNRSRVTRPLVAGTETTGTIGDGSVVREGGSARLGIQEFLPTGTTLQLDADTLAEEGDVGEDTSWTSRLGLTASQALLQGAGVDVNLVNVRQARIDTQISQYELRGFTLDLVAEVEQTYWDCVLAQRQIEIVESSLSVAGKQYEDTRERIRLGSLAELELAAAEAEVAVQEEALINARSALEVSRLKLWRLLNPRSVIPSDPDIKLATPPILLRSKLDDVDLHVRLAMRMRPDLNQARLLVQRNELELVRTRNGLLPRLDLFMTLGGTGYASSFGSTLHRLGDHNYDLIVGVRGEFPPINRAARAQNQRATLDHEQTELALANLSQLAEVDVRGACIELKRAQEQVRATAATRRLQEATFRAEAEKFRVGKSTSLLVAQAQRDLLTSQLGEVRAVITHLKAIVDLQRLEGSLLEYRGIACPGSQPVASAALHTKDSSNKGS